MTQTTDPNIARPDVEEIRQQLAGKHVCPFCGVIRSDPNQPCPRCTMEDTGPTRTATRQRIGPWFVLQARNPSAPGMRFVTLLSLVKKGHVTPRSIVRGPTTHQLWTFASKVRGLSREFGVCWHCGEAIEPTASGCSHCDRPQEPPAEPDALLEPGAASAAPEMTITAGATAETGMDGGASLDLQVDDGFGVSVTRPTRPPRAASPSVTSPLAKTSISKRPATPQSAAVPAKTTEEAILSAKELAAAFQLDFSAAANAGGGTVEQTPARIGVKANSVEKKRSFLKTLIVLLMIALFAAAIVLVLREDLRDSTLAWTSQTWASIKSKLEAPAPKPLIDTTPPKSTATTPPTDSPGVLPVKPTPPVVVVPPEPTPPPEPTNFNPDPDPVKPADPVVVTPVPEPTPPVKPEPVKPAPVKPIEIAPIDPNMDIERATALAQQLRRDALDAEGRDWPMALQLYEQIKKLPEDAWPRDLQIRIDRAKDKVAGK